MSKKSAKNVGKIKSSVSAGSPMDLGLLQELVRLMAANDLNTVEVRDGDKRVILKRGAVQNTATTISLPHMGQVTHSAPATTAAASGAASPQAADADAGLTPIKSPMVGTFYSSPSPDAKAFVIVGSTVDDETDVCIIEAMKVFNNIKAECRGTIAKILVTNGQTVEFGQTLFLVKPA